MDPAAAAAGAQKKSDFSGNDTGAIVVFPEWVVEQY